MHPMPKLKTWYDMKGRTMPYGNRVAFFGPMTSGKSYMADYLVRDKDYHKVSFAGKLKAIAYEMYNVQSKDGEGRKILQGLGSDLRKYDPDVWVKYALLTMKNLEGDGKAPAVNIVLDDLRYENEGAILRENGFILIQCQASEETRKRRMDSLYPNRPIGIDTHPSELEWRRIKPHFILLTDGEIAKHDVTVFLDGLK